MTADQPPGNDEKPLPDNLIKTEFIPALQLVQTRVDSMIAQVSDALACRSTISDRTTSLPENLYAIESFPVHRSQ